MSELKTRKRKPKAPRVNLKVSQDPHCMQSQEGCVHVFTVCITPGVASSCIGSSCGNLSTDSTGRSRKTQDSLIQSAMELQKEAPSDVDEDVVKKKRVVLENAY